MTLSLAWLRISFNLIALLALTYTLPAFASDTRLQPLAVYAGAPPAVVFSAAEKRQILAGDPVFKSFAHLQDVRVLAAFQVNAPPQIVWSVITDFANYSQWIKGVDTTRVYRQEANRVHVMFDVHHWFVGRYVYHIEHTLEPAEDAWITWRLDRSRPSDFDDTVGFWRISPLHKAKSLVTYSATLRLSSWVPGFIERQLARSTLVQATQWVRYQSEQRLSRASEQSQPPGRNRGG